MDKQDADGFGWNCVVGRNFGGHVIHQTKKYIFFQVKELSILLWKAWLYKVILIILQSLSVILFKYFDHFFLLGLVLFWAFWAALSWAFWAACFSLLTVFLSPCFLAIWAFFLSLISLMASSAKAFLSSALAFLSLLIASRVIPSMALFYSLLSSLFLLTLPASVCFIFLWSLLQAVAHLNLWALSFLNYTSHT